MHKSTIALAMGASFFAALTAPAQAEGIDPNTLLEQAAKAHGGTENWLQTPAIRLRYVMHLYSLVPTEKRNWSDSWRYYEATIEPDTSRVFVDLLHVDREGSEAGFDGAKLWDSDTVIEPVFQDPAFLLNWYHYAMIALPFIAQQEGAAVSYEGTAGLPNHEGDYHQVKIDYEPIGWSGQMTLYIDPETHLIQAWKQGAMFPPLPGNPIPAIQTPPGTPLRVVDEFTQVDGFTLARTYVSYNPAMEPSGFHMVAEAETLNQFDATRAAAPPNARVVFEKGAQ